MGAALLIPNAVTHLILRNMEVFVFVMFIGMGPASVRFVISDLVRCAPWAGGDASQPMMRARRTTIIAPMVAVAIRLAV